MSPDTNNPDFSFIMDQPGPEQNAAPKKQKNPLVIVLIVLAVLVVILAIVLKVASLKPVDVQPVNDNISGYLQDIKDGNFTNAQNRTSTNPKLKEQIFVVVAKTFQTKYQLSSCTVDKTDYKNPIFVSTVICPLAKTNKNATLTIESSILNNQVKITKITESN